MQSIRPLFGLVAFIVAMILTGIAYAVPPTCAPADVVAYHLETEYRETLMNFGRVNGDVVLKLYTTPTGSTWTVVLDTDGGVSCLVAAGKKWRDRLPAPAPEPQLYNPESVPEFVPAPAPEPQLYSSVYLLGGGWLISYRETNLGLGLGWPDFIPLPRDPDAQLIPAPRLDCNLVADAHVEHLLDTLPLSDIVETIRGPALAVFLRAFNASPPRSNHRADSVVIIFSEADPKHYRGVLIKDNCVVVDGRMKLETYRKLKLGEPINMRRDT